MIKVVAYTDGSCSAETMLGGAGSFISVGDTEFMISKGFSNTKTGRMEITAVILTLESIKERMRKDCVVIIYSDSQYVVNAITKWLDTWVRQGLRHRTNGDLWERYLAVANTYMAGHISLRWVKGHSGVEGNEIADRLAYAAYKSGEYEHDAGTDLWAT